MSDRQAKAKGQNVGEVTLPEPTQKQLKSFIDQTEQQILTIKSQMRAQANLYLQGVLNGMGLEGQWNLDAARMVLVKAETKPELALVPEEGV